jgi:hypothetical protein
MVRAKNPWRGTGHGSGEAYIRQPAPWDSRKKGYDGLSPAQKIMANPQTGRLPTASREANSECPKTGNMSTNVCRVKAIKKRLKGRTTGQARPKKYGAPGYIPV